jgi:hypothetical protein
VIGRSSEHQIGKEGCIVDDWIGERRVKTDSRSACVTDKEEKLNHLNVKCIGHYMAHKKIGHSFLP